MDWVEEENEEAYLVFLDMEKAFDRCSWTFLIEGLEAIGFDQSFIDFVKLAYSNTSPPKRKIVANGYLGPEFTLHSGVAQTRSQTGKDPIRDPYRVLNEPVDLTQREKIR
jgi:hypothetical protein